MKWFKRSFLAMVIAIFIAVEVQAATLRSDTVTNSNASPPTMNAPNVEGGTVRRARATYTLVGTEATGDVIEMVNMPRGAIIIRPLSMIAWDDLATTTFTMEVGDVNDPNRYCTSLAGNVPSTDTGSSTTFEESLVGFGGTYTHNVVGTGTNDDTLDITLTTVTAGLTGPTITVDVIYVGTN